MHEISEFVVSHLGHESYRYVGLCVCVSCGSAATARKSVAYVAVKLQCFCKFLKISNYLTRFARLSIANRNRPNTSVSCVFVVSGFDSRLN
jgi:hypothetical protein